MSGMETERLEELEEQATKAMLKQAAIHTLINLEIFIWIPTSLYVPLYYDKLDE